MTFTKWHNLTRLPQSNGKVLDVLFSFSASSQDKPDFVHKGVTTTDG